MKLGQAIINVAAKELGVTEVNGSNCGPRVNEYKTATTLPAKESWPWCAAFVCWCVREGLLQLGMSESATFRRPKTAGAFDFENWSLAQDNSTQTKRNPGDDILAGDILIFKFSHIGIASADASGSSVETIEGNTDAEGSREGGGVFRKTRKLSQVKTRIRFTV